MSEQGENRDRMDERAISDRERMMENMLAAAITDLKPLIDQTACDLGLTLEQVNKLGHYLGEAWVAGAKTGQAETLAQAIEAGMTVQPSDAGPPLPGDPSNN